MNYNDAGVLNDTYGAAYAGGQRFFTWTNDAFNPTAWGVATRVLPAQSPELLSTNPGTGSGGFMNFLNGVSPWNLIHSPVLWIILGFVFLIPVYHWLEYGK